jgi:hypothetical protein
MLCRAFKVCLFGRELGGAIAVGALANIGALPAQYLQQNSKYKRNFQMPSACNQNANADAHQSI